MAARKHSKAVVSRVARAVIAYEPDVEALTAAPTRMVIAAGVESKGTITWRTSAALADRLGLELTPFPSHHGGFLGGEFGQEASPRRSRSGCARCSLATHDPTLAS